MWKIVAATAMTLLSTQALAVYNANYAGQLTFVGTYADTDSIYISLSNQPSSHPACNSIHFVIEAAVPLERRKAMLARLLTAYASGEVVNIGYDSTGHCAEG